MSTIFTAEKLWQAYEDCRRRKRRTANAVRFEIDRERNIFRLLAELRSRRYRVSRHVCFITTHPTVREIFAADFRDRVVHHLLYRELRDIFEADFIPHSYANRVGKGTHTAVEHLRRRVRAMQAAGGGHYLKLDVRSFFRSIDRGVLYALVERRVAALNGESWREEVLWLCRAIIFNDPTSGFVYRGDPALRALVLPEKSLFFSRGRGLPIGNLTSQFFANVYLDELDQFAARPVAAGGLGCGDYVRYVDDLVILGRDPAWLRSLVAPIDGFLRGRLRLTLHPRKVRLQPIGCGIDFLGYFLKPTHTLVRQRIARRFKHRLRQALGADGLIAVRSTAMVQSYLGHLSHASAFNLKRKLLG